MGIREVAQRSGTSIASVSRVLNNPELVKPDLRARIEAAIRETGYIPDAAARALSSRRTRTIGVVIPTVDNAMFARGIEALQERLKRSEYLLLLATSGYNPEMEFRQAENLIKRGVDGLLLRGDVHLPALRKLLAVQRIPFVNVGVYHPDKPYPCVGINNERAAFQCTRYLIEQGHRRIGMIAAKVRHNDRAEERVAGVRRALSEAGIPLQPSWYTETQYTLDDARQGARTVLHHPPRPTALVCGNDVLAYGVMLEAERQGLRIPQDLSVMGFDDLDWSRHLRPSLTTMRVPTDEVWSRAGDYLIELLAGESPPLHFEVDVALVIRESTAPPAKDGG